MIHCLIRTWTRWEPFPGAREIWPPLEAEPMPIVGPSAPTFTSSVCSDLATASASSGTLSYLNTCSDNGLLCNTGPNVPSRPPPPSTPTRNHDVTEQGSQCGHPARRVHCCFEVVEAVTFEGALTAPLLPRSGERYVRCRSHRPTFTPPCLRCPKQCHTQTRTMEGPQAALHSL